MGSDLSEYFKMHRIDPKGLPLTAKDNTIYFLHRIPESPHFVGVQYKEEEILFALLKLSEHEDEQGQHSVIVPWKKPIGSIGLNIALLVDEAHRRQHPPIREEHTYQEPPIVYHPKQALSTDDTETADF